jgi:hypothetical protein
MSLVRAGQFNLLTRLRTLYACALFCACICVCACACCFAVSACAPVKVCTVVLIARFPATFPGTESLRLSPTRLPRSQRLTGCTSLFIFLAHFLSSACFLVTMTTPPPFLSQQHLCRLLSYNNITAVPDGQFAGLRSLTELWIPYNRISVVTPGMFQGLPSLQGM